MKNNISNLKKESKESHESLKEIYESIEKLREDINRLASKKDLNGFQKSELDRKEYEYKQLCEMISEYRAKSFKADHMLEENETAYARIREYLGIETIELSVKENGKKRPKTPDELFAEKIKLIELIKQKYLNREISDDIAKKLTSDVYLIYGQDFIAKEDNRQNDFPENAGIKTL